MGRQWLHAKRAIVNLKKGQTVGKMVKEITVAAKLGGADPAGNARLFAAAGKGPQGERDPRRDRAGDQEGRRASATTRSPSSTWSSRATRRTRCRSSSRSTPTTTSGRRPRCGCSSRAGVLGHAGSNKFLFDHVGIVEAHHPDPAADLEAAAIEAGANDFEALTHQQNDDIPEGHAGARFITERTAVHAVSVWLAQHGWSVVTSELGYIAKTFPELDDAGAGRGRASSSRPSRTTTTSSGSGRP